MPNFIVKLKTSTPLDGNSRKTESISKHHRQKLDKQVKALVVQV
jgi:hypothetical protein